jgi:hypothetical protein
MALKKRRPAEKAKSRGNLIFLCHHSSQYRKARDLHMIRKNDMQRLNYLILAVLASSLTSCELVGDIFKAGVWTGLLLVAVVIALVIWLITRFRR